jgi:hypothetical protein
MSCPCSKMMRICLPVNHNICISLPIVVPGNNIDDIYYNSISTLGHCDFCIYFFFRHCGIRTRVDKYSRIRGFDNSFAIGDISAFEIVDPKGSMISSNIAPQLAQFAVRQALL